MKEITDLLNRVAIGLKAAGFTLKNEKPADFTPAEVPTTLVAPPPMIPVTPQAFEQPMQFVTEPADPVAKQSQEELAPRIVPPEAFSHISPPADQGALAQLGLKPAPTQVPISVPVEQLDIPVTEAGAELPPAVWSEGAGIGNIEPITKARFDVDGAQAPSAHIAANAITARGMKILDALVAHIINGITAGWTRIAIKNGVAPTAPYLPEPVLDSVITTAIRVHGAGGEETREHAEEVKVTVFNALCDYVVRIAAETKNQDMFAAQMANIPPMTRAEYRLLFKAVKECMVAAGTYPVPVGGKLQQQVEDLADAKTDAKDAPAKGQGEKQLKRDLAGGAEESWVQVARRIARGLAANGPITIDDVTLAMAREYKVAPNEGDKAHVWKGSVFSTAEWSGVGQMPSRMKEAHGRPVTLWALKTWLAENILNGSNNSVSAYNLMKILSEFKRAHAGMPLERCTWYIGAERLSPDIRTTILGGKGMLYSIPVVFVDGSVGALLMPPNYARTVAPAATAAKAEPAQAVTPA